MSKRRLDACSAATPALRLRRWTLGTALACALVVPALATGSASAAETTWLCRPGVAPNPCLNSEEATVRLDGGASFVEHPQPANNPPIDCFYVYPTVSGQLAFNASEKVENEEIAIAESQASRFSQACKVYAPIYPQVTLLAINGFLGEVPPNAGEIAFSGVLNAFFEYLAKYNDGRGFELIGHSQGSAVLEELIRQVIEPNPALRNQLVGAIIPGGQVIVPEGKNVGGTFKTTPGCSRDAQTGCVVAYSSFLEEPAEKALFGRARTLGGPLPEVEHPQVLCVNPTVLAQGPFAGPARSYYPTFNAFEGKFPEPVILGPITQVPKAPTPWVATPGQYTAQCEARNGASWLQLTPSDPEDTRTETVLVNTIPLMGVPPQQIWGQHLVDINAMLGNLVTHVRVQGAAYLLSHQ